MSTPPSGVDRPSSTPRRTPPRNPWLARLDSPLAAYYLVLGLDRGAGRRSAWSWCCPAPASSPCRRPTSSRRTRSSPSRPCSPPRRRPGGLGGHAGCPGGSGRRLAWPLLAVGVVRPAARAQPARAMTVNGNRNWIAVGGFTLQPSEAAKLALIVWGAAVLERKRPMFDRPLHVLVPVVPVAALMLLLVLLGQRPGHRADHDRHRGGAAVRRGGAAAGVRRPLRRRRAAWSRCSWSPAATGWVGCGTWLSGERLHRLLRHLLADAPRQVGAGHRRLVGGRPGRQPGEVVLAARGPQRLHLRDHRRGARAWPARSPCSPCSPCSGSGCSGSSLASDDIVRQDRHRRGAGVGARAGGGQHRAR